MRNEKAVFLPATPYDESTEPSLFIGFEPGTRTLPAGFQTNEHFKPLPVDIVFEKGHRGDTPRRHHDLR